jgi:exopolysaccharide biosynthesis polyprenyl glycosylphosphotransferase
VYAQVADFVTSLGVFFLAYLAALGLHEWNENFFPPDMTPDKFDVFLAVVFSVVMVGVFEFYKAYNSQRFTSLSREAILVLKVVNLNTLLSISIIFFLKLSSTPRTYFIVYYVLAVVVFIAEKFALFYVASLVRKKGANRNKVILVGTGKRTADFILTAREHIGWGLDIVGILTSNDRMVGEKVEGVPVLENYADINNVLKRYNPEEVIVTLSTKRFQDITKIVDACQLQGVQVRLNSDFFGKFTRNFKFDNLYGLNIISFNISHSGEFKLMIKRVIDVIISFVMLVLLLPLFAGIAVVILIQDGRPVFFRWNVVGHKRKPIVGWKFRTMVKNADEMKKELMKQNEMSGPVFKITDDPRILRVGKFLRKYSLDELPQLWSVLKGDMSLVGPRPPLVYEFDEFSYWHRRKLSVKPGITCLWQISGRNNIRSFDDWAKLDLEYIDNWSLTLDFEILLKTIPAVVFARGAK